MEARDGSVALVVAAKDGRATSTAPTPSVLRIHAGLTAKGAVESIIIGRRLCGLSVEAFAGRLVSVILLRRTRDASVVAPLVANGTVAARTTNSEEESVTRWR